MNNIFRHANAEIVSVDWSKALAATGVIGKVDWTDVKGKLVEVVAHRANMINNRILC